MCLNVGGASLARSNGNTLARMAACGQTNGHLPQYMHNSSSHTGISCARLRLSHIEVPVGQVPSLGNALTGRRSPRLAMISAVTWRTNMGAYVGTGSGILRVLLVADGTLTLCR